MLKTKKTIKEIKCSGTYDSPCMSTFGKDLLYKCILVFNFIKNLTFYRKGFCNTENLHY